MSELVLAPLWVWLARRRGAERVHARRRRGRDGRDRPPGALRRPAPPPPAAGVAFQDAPARRSIRGSAGGRQDLGEQRRVVREIAHRLAVDHQVARQEVAAHRERRAPDRAGEQQKVDALLARRGPSRPRGRAASCRCRSRDRRGWVASQRSTKRRGATAAFSAAIRWLYSEAGSARSSVPPQRLRSPITRTGPCAGGGAPRRRPRAPRSGGGGPRRARRPACRWVVVDVERRRPGRAREPRVQRALGGERVLAGGVREGQRVARDDRQPRGERQLVVDQRQQARSSGIGGPLDGREHPPRRRGARACRSRVPAALAARPSSSARRRSLTVSCSATTSKQASAAPIAAARAATFGLWPGESRSSRPQERHLRRHELNVVARHLEAQAGSPAAAGSAASSGQSEQPPAPMMLGIGLMSEFRASRSATPWCGRAKSRYARSSDRASARVYRTARQAGVSDVMAATAHEGRRGGRAARRQARTRRDPQRCRCSSARSRSTRS